MKRPSKKDIQAAVDKLKEHKQGDANIEPVIGKPEPKKANKNRIRKKGV
jgi:hypothetical protein